MTYNQFERFINVIILYHETEEKLSDALTPFNSSYTLIEFCPEIISTIIETISEELDVSEDTITWWLYETDCGKNDAIVCVDDKEYVLDSPRKFYEYCING